MLDYAVLEDAARNELHGYVVRRPVLRATPVIDGDYVWVTEGRSALGLASEALDELLVVGVPISQDLERHVPIQNLVVS